MNNEEREERNEYLLPIRGQLVMFLKNKEIREEDRDTSRYFYYEAEYDAEVHSAIKSIQKSVLINFWGTVVSVKELDVPIELTEEEQAILLEQMQREDKRGQPSPFLTRVRGVSGDDQYNITITIQLERPIRRLDWENIEELLVMMLAVKSPGVVIKNAATGNILSDG